MTDIFQKLAAPFEDMRIVEPPKSKPFLAKARKFYPGDESGIEKFVERYLKGEKG